MASLLKEKMVSTFSSSSSSSSPDDDEKTVNYRLRITAGPTYDKSLQRLLVPNSPNPHVVSPSASVCLRIKDYAGLPSLAPATDEAYFSLPAHSSDTFSLSFAFTPPHDICAADLMFGLDTGHNPIRKFGIPKSLVTTAFRIAKEFVDPSLAVDVAADEPWLRGPVVAGATTTFRVGDEPRGVMRKDSVASTPVAKDAGEGVFPAPAVLEEGATSEAAARYRREEMGVPDAAGKRRKFFNSEKNRQDTVLQAGRTYYFDFANGYIDWKAFALKLPGFSVGVLRWLGPGKPPVYNEGQTAGGGEETMGGKKSPSHKVRFFLKDIRTGEVYFVIMCTLLTGEELGRALKEDEEMCSQQQQQQQQQGQ